MKPNRLSLILSSAMIPFLSIEAETPLVQEAHPSSPSFFPGVLTQNTESRGQSSSELNSSAIASKEDDLSLSEEFLAEMKLFDQKEENSEEVFSNDSQDFSGDEDWIGSLGNIFDSSDEVSNSLIAEKNVVQPEQETLFEHHPLVSLEDETLSPIAAEPDLTFPSQEDHAISTEHEPSGETLSFDHLSIDKELENFLPEPRLESITSTMPLRTTIVPEVELLSEPIANTTLIHEKVDLEESQPALEETFIMSKSAAFLDLKEQLLPESAKTLAENSFVELEHQIDTSNNHPELTSKPEPSATQINPSVEDPSLKKKNEPSIPIIDLKQVLSGSPLIYTALFSLSLASCVIWLYHLVSLRRSTSVSADFMKNLRSKLISNQYEDALTLCMQQDSFFSRMLASGITSRKYGAQVMLESMKAEGKRSTVSYWQKIALLNDIAIIAPMLGLLGTVLGMFYAFYDLNRSLESISTLFDGLGISVGTTVAGLFVAILSMIFHSLARFKLVRCLTHLENEANSLAALIDNRIALFDDKGA